MEDIRNFLFLSQKQAAAKNTSECTAWPNREKLARLMAWPLSQPNKDGVLVQWWPKTQRIVVTCTGTEQTGPVGPGTHQMSRGSWGKRKHQRSGKESREKKSHPTTPAGWPPLHPAHLPSQRSQGDGSNPLAPSAAAPTHTHTLDCRGIWCPIST